MWKAPAIAAALCVLGCAAENKGLRADVEAIRAEMQTMQRENGELAKRVEALSSRLDALAVRLSQRRAPESGGAAGPTGAGSAAQPGSPSDAHIPPNLAVVKVEPPRKSAREESVPRRRRAPPPVPTAVPISDPDVGAMTSLGAPRESLSAAAQADLDAAHRMSGLAAARALEAFTSHYPRHPSADNALVEAARVRAEAGEPDAACALYARCVEEYPAGDAMPEALEELGECHARHGQTDQARSLFERVVSDYPETSAAKRAAERLAGATARGAPRAVPSRQGAVP